MERRRQRQRRFRRGTGLSKDGHDGVYARLRKMTQRVTTTRESETDETPTTSSTAAKEAAEAPVSPPALGTAEGGAGEKPVELEQRLHSPSETGSEHSSNGYNHADVEVSRPRFIAIFIGLSVSLFLASLDQTIVSTALPAIANHFNALSDISWVGTTYLLTSTVFQPLYGKLADIFGRRLSFLFALAVFTTGSALCGAAQSMTFLVLSRGVAGIGGAGIMSLTQIILTDLTPLKTRGQVMGIIGAMYTISSVFGPLLGGLFTDRLSWRWCFFINLPLCAVSIGLIGVFLKIPHQQGSLWAKAQRIDVVGSAMLIASLILITLALNWGGKERPWDSPLVVIFFVVGGVLLVAFCVYECTRAVEPIICPSLFGHAETTLLMVIRFLLGIFMYTMIYYLPVYFIVVRNSSATSSGLHLLPFTIGAAVAGVVFGVLVNVVNTYRSPLWLAIVLIVAGAGLMTTVGNDTPNAQIIGYLILFGTGIGVTMSGIMVAVQINVARDIVAIATAVANFAWSIGGTVGLPVVSSAFINTLSSKLRQLSQDHPDHAEDIMKTMDNSRMVWKSGLPVGIRNEVIRGYVESLQVVYYLLVPVSAFALILSLFLRDKKVRPPRGGDIGQL